MPDILRYVYKMFSFVTSGGDECVEQHTTTHTHAHTVCLYLNIHIIIITYSLNLFACWKNMEN